MPKPVKTLDVIADGGRNSIKPKRLSAAKYHIIGNQLFTDFSWSMWGDLNIWIMSESAMPKDLAVHSIFWNLNWLRAMGTIKYMICLVRFKRWCRRYR